MTDTTMTILGGCIATIIPLLFVTIMVKEANSRKLLLFFCWGTFSGLLAYFGNNFFAAAPEQAGRVTTVIAPIVEEFFKALPLLFFLRKKQGGGIPVIIVYCALASGVGFSIQETLFYFSQVTGAVGDIVTLIVRTFTTSLMHGMAAAIIGMGLLFLQKHRHILLPVIAGLFALSVSIHALFNLLLPTNLAVVAMLMPIGLYFTGLAFLGSVNQDAEGGAV